MSLATFHDFCNNVYQCAEKLGDEIETNINYSQNLITTNETIDVKLPLEKVKLYHYCEIIKLLQNVKRDVKKILYHEKSINTLISTKKLSGEEIKHYFSVENVNERKSTEYFIRQERRRKASQVSLYTLSTWEAYLKNKEQEEAAIPEASIEASAVPKRTAPKSKRKQKKFVSSTFNDILENVDTDIESNCKSIVEENEDEDDVGYDIKLSKQFQSYSENNLTEMVESSELRSCVSVDNFGPTKPKIVDVLYKKPPVTEMGLIQKIFYPNIG
ncbi:uncharacterized protein LOC114333101 [Diabrotica virgifera virgifera]|uniref:Uncharacterized protein LOC114333101 n=1 Tax=Diabrotica virgifera virgifera TaxID=50390 RepID=A0A6P7G0Y2_DIAVI|nr:uncharacterized protein LOC114333101 [Diabrotica virgifera virgifera]